MYHTSYSIKELIPIYHYGEYLHVCNSSVIDNYPNSIWLLDQETETNKGFIYFKLIPCLKCGNIEEIQKRPISLRRHYKTIICPKIRY